MKPRELVALLLMATSVNASANVLSNPGFETGLAGWGTSGDVTSLACSFAAPGCPAGFGNYIATLNNYSLGVGSASLTQAVTIAGPGTYEFGAWIAYGTTNAPGNFSQGQVSLTVQGQGLSTTLGYDPNGLQGQFVVPAGSFMWTNWMLLQGTLTYAGVGPADFLININVQNYDASRPLALDVDNVFLRAAEVPEPGTLALLGLGLAGLAALRRRTH